VSRSAGSIWFKMTPESLFRVYPDAHRRFLWTNSRLRLNEEPKLVIPKWHPPRPTPCCSHVHGSHLSSPLVRLHCRQYERAASGPHSPPNIVESTNRDVLAPLSPLQLWHKAPATKRLPATILQTPRCRPSPLASKLLLHLNFLTHAQSSIAAVRLWPLNPDQSHSALHTPTRCPT